MQFTVLLLVLFWWVNGQAGFSCRIVVNAMQAVKYILECYQRVAGVAADAI